MKTKTLTLILVCGLAACSSSTGRSGSEATDTAATDTAATDTAATDTAVAETTEIDDAGTAVPDAEPTDAESVDVGEPPASPPILSNGARFSPGFGEGTRHVQPAVAFGEDGLLVVAWAGFDEDGGNGSGIFARPFDVTGEAKALGSAERLSADSAALVNEPRLCALHDQPGFVAVWSVDKGEPGPDGENLEVQFRLLDADGRATGDTVRVYTARPGNHWLGDVGCDPNGGFVVTGVRPPAGDGGFEVFTVAYTSAGDAVGEPFTPLAVTMNGQGQGFPSVGVTPDGTVISAFESTIGNDVAQQLAAVAEKDGVGTDLGKLLAVVGVASSTATVSVDPKTGNTMFAGINDAKLILRPLDGETIGMAIGLGEDPTMVTSAHALAPVGGGSHALVYARGTGSSVDIRVTYVAKQGVDTADTAATGKFPLAYSPAIAYRDGRVAVAWTEAAQSSEFTINAIVYQSP
ncbi:MAG: hypothetical protein ACI9OJ_001899 [Myxococcota bacterium]|jgi:hypothetical protein